MNKPISTKTHAIIDYATIGKLLVLPRVLGFSERLTDAITTLALGQLAYTLLTRHEGGVVKVLPMKAHLVMDAVGGAGLAALPWMLGEDEDDATAKVVCAAMGAFEVLASTMTQTESPQESGSEGSRRRQPAVARRDRERSPAIASPA